MKMLNRVSEWMIRRAGAKTIILTAAMLAAILIGMETSPIGKGALKAASGGMGMLDMRFAYSIDTVNRMFNALGTDGRQLYARLLALDVIFAFVFMSFESLMLSALIRRTGVPVPLRRLNLLPILRSGLDLTENALLFSMLVLYPAISGSGQMPALVTIASAITSAKWIVYYGIIVSLFMLGAIATMRPKEKKP